MTCFFYIKYKYFKLTLVNCCLRRQLLPEASLNTEQLVNPESFINIGNKIRDVIKSAFMSWAEIESLLKILQLFQRQSKFFNN